MAWTTEKGFKFADGSVFVPETDDLRAELVKAAASKGYKNFNVKVDGHYVDGPDALHTNSIAALIAEVRIEDVEITPHDTAG